MPSGIILSSGSQGATQEAIEKVLTDNGLEPDKPAAAAENDAPAEPKRDDFKTDEEFELAQEDFEVQQQEREAREEEEEDEPEAARAKPLTRKQKAIAKATRSLEEKNRKLEERLAALEKGEKPGAAAAAEPTIKVPKRDDFKSDAEFDEAMFDYRYQVRRAKEANDAAQRAQNDRLKQNHENYVAAVGEFKETHDDWNDVVNQKIPITESVYLTIQELENGPAVTYYLGKHPAYAEKLAGMSPLAAVVEVGRLSDRLKTGTRRTEREADGAAKPKPKPRIPEPVKPVSTAATASSLTSAEAAKKRDFRAFKAAQRAGR
jgi:hypothetical protein